MLALLLAMVLGAAPDSGPTAPLATRLVEPRDRILIGMTAWQVYQVVGERPRAVGFVETNGASFTVDCYPQRKLAVYYREGRVAWIDRR